MDTKDYLKKLTKQISVGHARKEIMEEYIAHMEDHKEALMDQGFSEAAAEREVLKQLGDPTAIGRELNKVHRRGIEWTMTGYFLICAIIINVVPYFFGYGRTNASAPNYLLYGIAGIIASAGFLISFMEKYTDSALFYAWAENWNGGGITNSGLILAIAVYPVAGSLQLKIFWILLLGLLLTVQRYFIALVKDRKERRLLWEIGVAVTDISYKGIGLINGKKLRLKTNRQLIKKNTPFIVIGMEGFRPVAVAI